MSTRRRWPSTRTTGTAGSGGGALWLADKLTSLPKEADQIFVRAKARYEQRMSDLISGIADFIGAQLTAAKDRIAAGRKEIKAFVAQQPKDLQKVAGEAAEKFEAQFDQLEGDVDSKQDGLVQDLASKYVEARTAVDEEITAAQEENKGLWDKAKDAIGGAIQTVLKLKDMLLGVLARAAGAIGKIIKDPIGFLGNFVNAVKGGILGLRLPHRDPPRCRAEELAARRPGRRRHRRCRRSGTSRASSSSSCRSSASPGRPSRRGSP